VRVPRRSHPLLNAAVKYNELPGGFAIEQIVDPGALTP
jgi:hypothetical protein